MAHSAEASVSKTGYQGFGSFHSDDVEVLIRQAPSTYSPPALPFEDPASSAASSCSADSFGRDATKHFLIDMDSWTFINHGAFGGVSRPAYSCAELWRRHCEKQPLRFIDRELFPQLVRVIRELAAFVNCRPQDLVLLPNATTGLNAVISSCKLQPGDVVYSLNIGLAVKCNAYGLLSVGREAFSPEERWVKRDLQPVGQSHLAGACQHVIPSTLAVMTSRYGSVKKMLQAACDVSGATQVVGQVMFPISGPEDVVSVVECSMPSNTKLAVFDAVTSNTALVLPIQELVQLCKSRGIPVLIDGAHALGMLPVNLQQLQPDFFVSNCHKWLCGARGSAMLYAAEHWQQQLQPPVLSHGAEAGFLSRFIWDGCRDYAPLLAISTAVRWWKGLGEPTAAAAAASSGSSLDGGDGLEPNGEDATAVQQVVHHEAATGAVESEQATAAAAAGGDDRSGGQSSGNISSTGDLKYCNPEEVAHAGDGGAAARSYMYQLLRSAADMLAQQWGTCCLGPPSMTAAMVLVQLPAGGILPAAGKATSADAKYIQDLLHSRHGIEVPVKTIQDTLYVRISAHIYNTLQDYVALATVVQQMLQGEESS